MSDERTLWDKLEDAKPTTRREFLKRASILGVSMPIFGSLLVACGGDDAEEDTGDTDSGDTDTGGDDATEESTEESTEEEDEGEATEEPDDSSGEEGEGQYGGRIVLMGHHSVESLHPDDAGPTVTWSMTRNIHDGLLAINEYYEIENELASDYEVSDDGLTYTLTLEEGVTWHDGEDFTAEDVVYTYEWYMNEENAAITGAYFLEVDSVEAQDDYTVVVNMANPDASFLRLGLKSMIVPAHYHEEVGYEEYSGSPIGTGPYKLVEWFPDEHTLLEANEDYFKGRPYSDELELRVVPEPSVRAIELESGGADSSVWTLNVDDSLRLLEENTEMTHYRTVSTACNHFPINNTRAVFEDVQVRRALMHAIDRQQVIDAVFAGAAQLATANLSPALEEFYEPDVTQYDFDPDRARELLDEAGWVVGDDGIRAKDGERLGWTCTVITGDEARRPEAEMVAEMLSEVGVEMQIQENPQASQPMRAGTIDMALYNWTYGGSDGEPDARIALSTDAGNNFSHYSNPEMDELLNQGVEEVDPEARAEIYSEVQKLFAEDVPFLYMMYWDWFNHWTPRIKGLPDDDIQNGSNVYRRVRTLWIEE